MTRKKSKRAANLSDSTKVLGHPKEFGYGERSLNTGVWRDTYLFSSFGGGLFFLSARFFSFTFAGGFLVEIDKSLRTLAHRCCCCGGGTACRVRCHPARPARGEWDRNESAPPLLFRTLYRPTTPTTFAIIISTHACRRCCDGTLLSIKDVINVRAWSETHDQRTTTARLKPRHPLLELTCYKPGLLWLPFPHPHYLRHLNRFPVMSTTAPARVQITVDA